MTVITLFLSHRLAKKTPHSYVSSESCVKVTVQRLSRINLFRKPYAVLNVKMDVTQLENRTPNIPGLLKCLCFMQWDLLHTSTYSRWSWTSKPFSETRTDYGGLYDDEAYMIITLILWVQFQRVVELLEDTVSSALATKVVLLDKIGRFSDIIETMLEFGEGPVEVREALSLRIIATLALYR